MSDKDKAGVLKEWIRDAIGTTDAMALLGLLNNIEQVMFTGFKENILYKNRTYCITAYSEGVFSITFTTKYHEHGHSPVSLIRRLKNL